MKSQQTFDLLHLSEISKTSSSLSASPPSAHDLRSPAQPSSDFTPLAEQKRPTSLDQMIGQRHLIGPGMPLYSATQEGHLHSMILWGPPGVGKTTLARILAQAAHARFQTLSAVQAGVKELRALFAEAQYVANTTQQSTVLFIDEIHRFNTSQQDVILPEVESGRITLIGATTENPSFSLNNALLSRVMVYILHPLTTDELARLLKKTLETHTPHSQETPSTSSAPSTPETTCVKNTTASDSTLHLTDDQHQRIARMADGDARRLLNYADRILSFAKSHALKTLDDAQLHSLFQAQPQRFDHQGDIFYDQLSAFHKSVRGSSPDGALYWMARWIHSGGDPRHLIRRLTAIASEDIGNADPRALEITVNAWDAYERLGDAEGCRAIAHAAVYCAAAPKSNAIDLAYQAALEAARQSSSLPVPDHLCNAPTALLKNMGKGTGYRYAHDEPNAYAAGQTYLPEPLQHASFYTPTDYGFEQKIRARLETLKTLDHPQKEA